MNCLRDSGRVAFSRVMLDGPIRGRPPVWRWALHPTLTHEVIMRPLTVTCLAAMLAVPALLAQTSPYKPTRVGSGSIAVLPQGVVVPGAPREGRPILDPAPFGRLAIAEWKENVITERRT